MDRIEKEKRFMKKNRIGGKIFIIFVLALLVTVGAYVFMSKQIDIDNPSTDEKESEKGEVRFLNSKQDGAIITQKYKAYINDKVLDLEIRYTYKISDISATDNTGFNRLEVVEGTFNNITLFSHKVKSNSTSQKAEMFDTGKIDKVMNGDFFKVIRGTDGKDYIAVATHIYDALNVPSVNYLYILNDDLEIINRTFDDVSHCSRSKQVMMIHPGDVGLLAEANIWYPNQFNYDNLRKNYTSLKIDGDKIYYLYHNIELEDGNFGTIEERVYTIKDNKLEYTTVNTYQAAGKYGDVC